MAEIVIITADPAHIPDLAANMRRADVEEIRAGTGRSPAAALSTSLAMSTHAWTCMVDGEPACMWGVGVRSMLLAEGSPWLLGTDHIERHQRRFMKESRVYLAEMLGAYRYLVNWVDARNRLSVGWLKRLGFTIDPAEPMGVMGMPFHRFWMGSHV